MEISSRNEFSATPEAVIEMLTTPAFLEAVCAGSGATSHTVDVDGLRTVTRRVLEAPAQAQKIMGPTITIAEDVTWSAAGPDGARSGSLGLSVPGMPVTMNGTASLRPGGRGTIVEYVGDFKVNIPFLGKKLEGQAAPAIVEALAVQQRVGDEWLAR